MSLQAAEAPCVRILVALEGWRCVDVDVDMEAEVAKFRDWGKVKRATRESSPGYRSQSAPK